MTLSLVIHIAAGSIALISGYAALYAAKGATVHRRMGTVFVYSMLTMCFFGALIAAVRGVAPALNVPAGVLSAYLVITALVVLRPPAPAFRWLDPALMLVALTVGLTTLTFTVQAFGSPDGKRHGLPGSAFLLFAVVGIVAAIGDIRMIRFGRPQGMARIRRHLWRMSFALFIAALSFFIGQAKVIPQAIRIPGLLVLPVLAVLATMIYWLVRTRRRARRQPRSVAPFAGAEMVR